MAYVWFAGHPTPPPTEGELSPRPSSDKPTTPVPITDIPTTSSPSFKLTVSDAPVIPPTLPPQATTPPFGEGTPQPTDVRPTPPPTKDVSSPRPSSDHPTTPVPVTDISSSHPTFSPSISPSGSSWGESSPQPSSAHRTPTPSSVIPTPSPSCESTTDADICIAVDLSGSICNKSSQQLRCDGCSPQKSCRDSFISEDTCCVNFKDVQVFASTLVARLGEEMTGSDNFSLVQFADESFIQSELASANTAIQKVSEMHYTGGMTNTEAALTSCQSTLANSNKKKYIVLVTDGVPTTSDRAGNPVKAALGAAEEVKTEDIFVVTAFIDRTINDDSGKELMMEISSGDSLYNVADFDDLDTIVDAVAEPVLCAMDNSGVTTSSQDEDCPDKWMETIYDAGDVVSADGIVFQCMPEPFSLQCGQKGYNPGTESLRWKRAWALIGYCSNLGEASPQPSSPQPTPMTSYLPTTQQTSIYIYTVIPYPTSSSYDEPCDARTDVDICIAVDSSGSNFHYDQVFASTLVARLGEELKGSNNFSLVQFADESSIQSELTSCDTEIQRVSEISYTGGMTNTEAALTSCHETLENSNKKKYVVLVTDGVPTTSDREGEPVHAALDAADDLKMDDIFIITAFTEHTINDDSGKELMMQISSGDSLYNVADFDDLETIVDAVAEPVLCGKDNNIDIILEGSSTSSWEQGSSTSSWEQGSSTSSWEQGSSTTLSWEQGSSTTNSQG